MFNDCDSNVFRDNFGTLRYEEATFALTVVCHVHFDPIILLGPHLSTRRRETGGVMLRGIVSEGSRTGCS